MIRRRIGLAAFLIMLLSISGVYATWIYAEIPLVPKEQMVDVSISTFVYTPEQVLPGGDGNNETVALGENHYKVIDLIVNSAGNGYALNSKSSIFHSKLENTRALYSNQKISGGNLKFVLDEKYNTYGLYYCVEKASDTLYYAYTFAISDLAAVAGSNTEICVYKTKLEKQEGKWIATTSEEGYAKTFHLRSVGVSAASQSLEYTIDIDSWH